MIEKATECLRRGYETRFSNDVDNTPHDYFVDQIFYSNEVRVPGGVFLIIRQEGE